MQFAAVLRGKTVTYPSNAEFVVERKINRKWGILATRPTISAALTTFHRQERKLGSRNVRLFSAMEGKLKRLM